MLLIVLAFVGGVLTILSPCILPVLPFVFSTAGQSFRRNILPMLIGMALTFTALATLAAVGGGWIVAANEYGRWLAMALVALFGLSLLLPRLAERLAHPLVNAGSDLAQNAQQGGTRSARSSLLLGVATGLLWSPCAGPILGLVLTGAAVRGAGLGSTTLLLAYAMGAATSLALALLLGGKVFAAMKRALGVGEWIRRGLGAAMLAGVAAIALGLDTTVLANVSTVSTTGVEQFLIDRFGHRPASRDTASRAGQSAGDTSLARPVALKVAEKSLDLPDEGGLPSLDGAIQWLNSPPLTAQALRGKVVLIDFWTFSCINCLHALPYVKAWEAKYRDEGLVVIGVHAPEFAYERDIDNVKKAIQRLGIVFPVAIDNNFAVWNAFNNEYWPAHYFVDAQGRIRYHHFGEGAYEQSERVIRQLLREAGRNVTADPTPVRPVSDASQGPTAPDLRRASATQAAPAAVATNRNAAPTHAAVAG